MADTVKYSRLSAANRRVIDDRQLTIALIVIVLIAAVMRLYGLDRTSIWNDEGASWLIARQPFWGMIRATIDDTNPPLFNIILYTAIRLFGDSETVMRLPSAILGILNVYLLYRLGAALWDRLTGVIGAALLTVSGFHLWFSQEARMYSLLCVTTTAFALTSVLFLKAPNRTRAILCGLSGAALLYSHVYGAFNWVAINAVLGLCLLTGAGQFPATLTAWIIVQVLSAASFLPWTVALVGQAQRVIQDFWIPFPTPRFLFWTYRAIASGAAMLFCLVVTSGISLFRFDQKSPGLVNTRSSSSIWSRARLVIGWQHVLLLALIVIPLAEACAVSLMGRPIVYDRYLIGSLPAMLLLAARGVWVLQPNRVAFAGVIALLIACSIPGAVASLVTTQREDFRGATNYFAAQYKAGDSVVFASPGVINGVGYYDREPLPNLAVIHDAKTDPFDRPETTRLWLVARDDILAQGPLLQRIEAKYHRQQEQHFFSVSVYLYVRSAP